MSHKKAQMAERWTPMTFRDLEFKPGVRGPKASANCGSVSLMIETQDMPHQGPFVLRAFGVTEANITAMLRALTLSQEAEQARLGK